MPQTIYCDEAGFTGNNLLDVQQPFFTYAAVAIDPATVKTVIDETIREFGIGGNEVKGQRLLGFNRGRQAISHILGELASHALVSAFHKRYSLASKFFEYIFEPVLAQQNSIFYSAGFHRFISNVIYFEALRSNDEASTALSTFQALVRERDATRVPVLFPTQGLSRNYSEVLRDIETFVVCHQQEIANEIASFATGDPIYSWILDLSVSALFALLTTWGERFDNLVALCDDSKPLRDHREHFDMMIGRTDRAYVTFEGKRQSLIFNLAEPLQFVRSQDHAGIQVADVFASALGYALKNPTEKVSRDWIGKLENSISEFSVFPDDDLVDLETEKGFVNRAVLRELVDRSVKQASLFDGMPRFIAFQRLHYASALGLLGR